MQYRLLLQSACIVAIAFGYFETAIASGAEEFRFDDADNCSGQNGAIVACVVDKRLLLALDREAIDRPILITQYPVEYLVAYPLVASPRVEDNDLVLVTGDRIDSVSGFDIDRIGPIQTGRSWEKGEGTLGRFPLIARSVDGDDLVVDFSDWAVEFFMRRPVQGGLGAAASGFVSGVMSFEDRIAIEVSTTHKVENTSQSITAKRILSVTLLPQRIMSAREFDPRMGFSHDEVVGAVEWPNRANILRYRLEKARPDRLLSRPIQPIEVFLDPRTPQPYRESIESGILAWNSALEGAGFVDAITLADTPEGVNWSLFRVGHTVLTWIPQPNSRIKYRDRAGGGTGLWLFDPRSGEILASEVTIRHPEILLRDRYYTRCSAADHRIRSLRLPDELMADLVEVLVSHEFGHALGLVDGHYGKHAYTVNQLRDPEWLAHMQFTPSVMNYSRCNYVAQPNDGLDVELLHGGLGPADRQQIKWGYSAFGSDRTSTRVGQLVDEAQSSPWLRFFPTRGSLAVGPQVFSEVIGSRDVVEASKLGLQNLRHIVMNFDEHIQDPEIPREEILHLYGKLIERRQVMVAHAIQMIGGYLISYEGKNTVFDKIPSDQQLDALEFVIGEIVELPDYLLVERIERLEIPSSTRTRLLESQRALLRLLLSQERLGRIDSCTTNWRQTTKATTFCFESFVSSVVTNLFSESGLTNHGRTKLQQDSILELQDLAVKVLSDYVNSEADRKRPLCVRKRQAIQAALSESGLLKQRSTIQ